LPEDAISSQSRAEDQGDGGTLLALNTNRLTEISVTNIKIKIKSSIFDGFNVRAYV